MTPDPVDLSPAEPYTRGRFLRELAVALALLGVGLPLVLLLGRSADGGADRVATPSGPPAYVLSGSSLPRAVAEAAVGAVGFRPQVQALPGAGFAEAPDGRTILGVLREQDLSGLQLLVLQGGEADNTAAEGELGVALVHLFDYLDATAPDLPVVVVGPIPDQAATSSSLRRSGATLRASSTARSAPYVDPLSLGWTAQDADLGDKLEAALRPLVSAPAPTPS